MNSLVLGTKEYPLGTNTDDSSPSGGMELYVEELVEHLKRYSDITLITRKFTSTKKHEKKNNVDIWRVSWLNGFLLRNPTFNLASFFKSLRLDYDVIISHGEVANFFGLLASRIRRKPIVMVNHGLAAEQNQYNVVLRKGFSLIDRITYSRADAVITHSPSKLPRNVSYNLIKPGFGKSRLKRDTSLRKKYKTKGKIIVFTGRLTKAKGIEYLIRGLKGTCFIVGDGPERSRLEKIAKQEKANVIFTGFRKDINRFLSIADAFVLPSFSESLNYSMLEAAYMHVPIISTDLGILPKNAFIPIDKKSPKSITNAIEKLHDPELRKNITKNAYEFTKQFDWNIAAKNYYQVLKSIVKEYK
ncbi:MAG: glycosyltransferase family 4 protein [Candidatus Aenigmatarchaeota archaeon]|nr:glycosyltransferase family 4 protein [Nanoarchaeota archaeon]